MARSSVSDIKRAQKESLLLRVISELVAQTALDDERLRGIFVTRVTLSSDKSSAIVSFYSHDGAETFKEKLEVLKLYKPSLRKSLASRIEGRYTPQIIFRFDDKFEKTSRIEELLNKIKAEEEASE